MEDIKKALLQKMIQSIKTSVPDKKIGLAFSGGVDSSLLAKLSVDAGYDVTLLTIGFSESHDIEFSKEIGKLFELSHQIEEIDSNTFDYVLDKVNKVVNTDNLSWNENCIAFYYVAKLAKRLGLQTVLTANGIDELFCGYDAYRDAIGEGKEKVMQLMESKLENEKNMMKAVNNVVSEFSVKIVQPFLEQDFIDFAKKIPLELKIKNSNDLMRKHVVRELAAAVGVPEKSAFKRKKALQYGSLIHKTLMKSR
ncbi:MAG: asparagine synthase-related protein [Nitrosopumilaceae archaeon]